MASIGLEISHAYLKDRRIGEVLVHMGHLTAEQVEDAVYEAKHSGEKIGRVLIRTNRITSDALCRALAVQSGLPMVDLSTVEIAPALRRIFTHELMQEHHFVVFGETPSALMIGVGQPLSPRVLSLLKDECGLNLEMHMAREDLIALCIDQFRRDLAPRKHPRIDMSLPAQYQFCTRLGTPLESNMYLVSTLNVSLGGVALQGAPPLPEKLREVRRQDIYAQVLLKDTNDIRAICQLRWVRKQEHTGSGNHLIGFEFVEMSSRGKYRLQNLCVNAELARNLPFTQQPPAPGDASKTQFLSAVGAPPLTVDMLRGQMRSLGLLEEILIHEQTYHQFVMEKGIKELGRGGEASVYFLRGHVVKVANRASALAAAREIAHMLHLNPLHKKGTFGERERPDWPSLLWVYVLSNGSVAIGMKPFDPTELPSAMTLAARLAHGPVMLRIEALEMLKYIGESLTYAHSQGIIHHDLKPANIFIPAESKRRPVVFDLGQSLWKKSSWGRDWIRHEHNLQYQFNGTYRYMHARRRRAHAGALALSRQKTPTPKQSRALEEHQPSIYDDIFAYARIIRECAKCPKLLFSDSDRHILLEFSRELMGLIRTRPREIPQVENRLSRLTSIFKKASKESSPITPTQEAEAKWPSMERVLVRLNALTSTW